MKPFAFLIVLFFVIGCKKGSNLPDEDAGKIAANAFSYINPQGTPFADSIIVLPPSGYLVNSNNPHQVFSGSTFVSKPYWETVSGNKLYPDSDIFVQWKVKDLASEKVVKTDTTTDIQLDLFEIGKYKLTQYLYANAENRRSAILALDSASKIIEVVNSREIDSIMIDTLGFASPYLHAGLDPNAPVDVFVSIYKDRADLENQQPPLFQSASLKGIAFGAKHLKFEIPDLSFSPSFIRRRDINEGILLQLNVQQGGKTYTLLDNEHGYIVQTLQTGYLSNDNSSLLEELRLRFQSTSLRINTSFTFKN
ncbi:hypothetical protein [Sphingobacterium paludis]|uniref:Uncharacterized protein n=1 Tax=Sphingobacterium paludis TaxID=1476465 RepID=A0A4R7CWF4_9SPHI|nr:hypothetical protein [Sphingobacterium paludis]TDS10993.1 hypothetical protein B0I21_10850 [Sphingobacterium paludis]